MDRAGAGRGVPLPGGDAVTPCPAESVLARYAAWQADRLERKRRLARVASVLWCLLVMVLAVVVGWVV